MAVADCVAEHFTKRRAQEVGVHDYDFGGILQGLLDYHVYRDHRVIYTGWDGQNTIFLDIRKPGGEIVRAELKYKVL